MQALNKLFDQLPDRMYPNRKNDSHIFTPPTVAKEMIDALPDGIWNSKSTFLDICCKSGALLYAIYAKLMNSKGLAQEFPDAGERRKHIVNNQLFGISPDQACQLLSTRAVYGCIVENSHIIYLENYTNVMTNSDRRFLIETLKREFGTMKFDVVVGNPPYNKGMDLDFVDIGFKLSTDSVCMITPAKWQTAEADQKVASKNINYGQFREKYVPHMSYVCFYPDCKDVFDIYQVDGISYYLLDKNNTYATTNVVNKCKNISCFNGETSRNICNAESLLNIGDEIISNLGGGHRQFCFMPISHNKQYEVWMNTKVSGYDWYVTDRPRYVLSTSRILNNSIGETYDGEAKCIFESNNIDECYSFLSWVYTKFTRFFLVPNISKLNNIQTDHCFRFVPAPPSGKFDHIYTDEELYKAFNLPQKYIDIIESVIKERK